MRRRPRRNGAPRPSAIAASGAASSFDGPAPSPASGPLACPGPARSHGSTPGPWLWGELGCPVPARDCVRRVGRTPQGWRRAAPDGEGPGGLWPWRPWPKQLYPQRMLDCPRGSRPPVRQAFPNSELGPSALSEPRKSGLGGSIGGPGV